MEKIRGTGDAMPKGSPPQRYEVVYAKPGSPVEVLILSQTWTGFDAHWLTVPGTGKGRTVLCELPDDCPCQHLPLPSKWHGYLPVILVHRRKRAILSNTRTGMLSILDAAGDATSLRGLMLLLNRSSLHPSSITIAERSPKDWRGEIPEEHDLLITLETIYGSGPMARWRERHLSKVGAR